MEYSLGGGFSERGKSYLYQVAAERQMNQNIVYDDAKLWQYLQQVSISNKEIKWGIEQEANARNLYVKRTGRMIEEVGSCKHPMIDLFSSSPDGRFTDEATVVIGCIEIKCPNQATFMRYKTEIHDAASLLAVNRDYYYQCIAHMMCTGAQWTDFIVYCPFQEDDLHIVRINQDGRVFRELERRILQANGEIRRIIHKGEIEP